MEKAPIFGHNDRLLTLHNSIKTNINSYLDKSTEPSTKLSDLGILDQLIQLDSYKFAQELDSLVSAFEQPLDLSEEGNSSSSTSPKGGEGDITESLKDLKESSIFNINILYSIDWFEGLNGIKKIAVFMILGKSVIFSALLSIIFNFYGNILIEKYDLENRYPRFYKLIQLRRKFQKYYFYYSCFLIILIILIDISFALAVFCWL
jgi:hypothetical protein